MSCTYKHRRNMSADGRWTVLCTRLILWDTNETEALVFRITHSFHSCCYPEQPSWILKLGLMGFVQFSESEIQPQGSFQLNFFLLGRLEFLSWNGTHHEHPPTHPLLPCFITCGGCGRCASCVCVCVCVCVRVRVLWATVETSRCDKANCV